MVSLDFSQFREIWGRSPCPPCVSPMGPLWAISLSNSRSTTRGTRLVAQLYDGMRRASWVRGHFNTYHTWKKLSVMAPWANIRLRDKILHHPGPLGQGLPWGYPGESLGLPRGYPGVTQGGGGVQGISMGIPWGVPPGKSHGGPRGNIFEKRADPSNGTFLENEQIHRMEHF